MCLYVFKLCACAGGAGPALFQLADSIPGFDALRSADNRTGWVDDGSSACTWTGITCTDGAVNGLSLSNWSLSGSFQLLRYLINAIASCVVRSSLARMQ